jgi:putative flavoprotein involved in K+ transport
LPSVAPQGRIDSGYEFADNQPFTPMIETLRELLFGTPIGGSGSDRARSRQLLRTPIGRKMAHAVRHGGGPLLRHRRQDLLDAGVVWYEARTVGARDGKPLLDDGQVLDVASVVWCTGFRPAYDWIDLPVLDEDGWPVIERGAAVDASGLWFLGVPFLSGFTSMLVLGAGRDAEMVVRQVAERAGRPARREALTA